METRSDHDYAKRVSRSSSNRNSGTEDLTHHGANIWLEDLQRRASGRLSTSDDQSYARGNDRQEDSRGFGYAAATRSGPDRSHASSERWRREPRTLEEDEEDKDNEDDTSDESAAYGPVRHTSSNENSHGRGERKQGSTLGDEEEEDLDEIAAPEPAKPESREDPSIETQRRQGSTAAEEEEDDLDEVTAPEPVQRDDASGRWQRASHLEDAPEEDDSNEKTQSQSDVSKAATQLYIAAHLIFWSFLGVLARLGMQWITFYPGAPVVFSNLWANFGGTIVMGFISEDRKLFQQEWHTKPAKKMKSSDSGSSSGSDPKKSDVDPRGTEQARAAHLKTKKTIPLYIGITVGFCGSFTSFSTFMRDVFLALANKTSTPINHPSDTSSPSATVSRNGGYSFEALIAVIIITVTVCIGVLQLGAHIAIAVDRFTPTIPFRLTRRILDPFIVFLAVGCWVGAIVMAAVPPDRVGGPAYTGHTETWRGQVLFALVFAPLGTLLRFYLALKLNAVVSWFPLGTFAANIFGTAVLGMGYDLQRAPLMGNGVVGVTACQALQGVEDGFCGCLTTISTWIVELTTLRRRHGYFYGAASVVIGLGMLIVVQGSVLWTVGYQTPSCTLETS